MRLMGSVMFLFACGGGQAAPAPAPALAPAAAAPDDGDDPAERKDSDPRGDRKWHTEIRDGKKIIVIDTVFDIVDPQCIDDCEHANEARTGSERRDCDADCQPFQDPDQP